jgi:predicted HD superfamily hydrolase involved in NAD metabolism
MCLQGHQSYNAAASMTHIEQLLGKLASFTSERRMQHSRNVMDAAAQLALFHAPELLEPAQVAGLLHDNAKRLTDAELLAAAQRLGLEPDPVEMSQPSLLHGKVGAALLPERFELDDAAVAQAIADHVTGRPGMGQLSRLLYVADQIAADRRFAGVELLRRIAIDDLELAVLLVARNKLLSVVQRGYLIEPATAGLYNEQVLRGLRLPAEVQDSGDED